MDKLEQFFQQHRSEFDDLKASDALWEAIDQQLDEPGPSELVLPLWRRWNIRVAAAVAVLLVAGLAWWGKGAMGSAGDVRQVGLEVDNVFPDVALRDMSGELVSLSSLKGKIVLVNFWASYSTLCTTEFCYFFKPIYNEYKDKGFEIYAISVDSSAVSWIDAVEQNELDWVQVSDLQGTKSHLFQSFKVDQLPTSYLLDENGRIIAKDVDASELEVKLDDMLAFRNK